MTKTEKMKLQKIRTSLELALALDTVEEKNKAIKNTIKLIDAFSSNLTPVTINPREPIPVPIDPTLKDK